MFKSLKELLNKKRIKNKYQGPTAPQIQPTVGPPRVKTRNEAQRQAAYEKWGRDSEDDRVFSPNTLSLDEAFSLTPTEALARMEAGGCDFGGGGGGGGGGGDFGGGGASANWGDNDSGSSSND